MRILLALLAFVALTTSLEAAGRGVPESVKPWDFARGAVSRVYAYRRADDQDAHGSVSECDLPPVNILFEGSQSIPGPGARAQLAALAAALSGSTCAVTVTGHASAEGATDANLSISTDRAQAVSEALANLSLRATSTTGLGETTAFGPEPAANRRVVIAITP